MQRLTLIFAFLAAVCLSAPHAAADAVRVSVAVNGQAQLPIVVSPNAAGEVRVAAQELADTLSRISGGSFQLRTGPAEAAIFVGTLSDFPQLPFDTAFDLNADQRDQFLLRTFDKSLYLIGTTPAAVECAVWDFLHRQGYRLFFLTDTWEVVPQKATIDVSLNTTVSPDYITRQAPRGAPWSDRDLVKRWQKRNRMNSSFVLNTGHAYGGIRRRNKQAFAEHPEYFALVGDKRPTGGDAKFCVSNPGLRELVVADAVAQIKANPAQDSVSMDPSDGGGWCECDACAAMGSPSDRALTLANEAADAINKLELGPKYVGMYAYNDHSPPPNIKAHPRVVISVATSFIRGGYSVEELVSGWQSQEAVLGIRDYHDVFAWSHDAPRRARGGRIAYLTRTIPWFYEHGARFMNSENMDSWGANGLGYWLTPQLLWDVENAERVYALIDDFLSKAFETAHEPMREFYRLLNLDHDSVRSHEDVVARLYRQLQEAKTATTDDRVLARLDDLVLYVRYLELYGEYRAASGKDRQRLFEQVWRHAYRIRDRMLLSTVALCHRDRFRDRSVTVPEQANYSVPEADNPWKSSQPFDDAELRDILEAGIAANQPTVLNFDARVFSSDLVPATRLGLAPVKPGRYDNRNRGRQQVFTWLPQDRREIALQVTGGLIAHYRDRGPVRFALHSDQEVSLEAVATDDSVLPDGEPRSVVLRSPHQGLHRLEWNDGSDMTQVIWPDNLPMTVRSTLDEPMRLGGRWDLYFYVPKGTTIVGGYSDSTRGRLVDGAGNLQFDFGTLDAAGYFSVDVPEGQDGALWKFVDSRGSRLLMTVPPYLATSLETLLLPREVVVADQ